MERESRALLEESGASLVAACVDPWKCLALTCRARCHAPWPCLLPTAAAKLQAARDRVREATAAKVHKSVERREEDGHDFDEMKAKIDQERRDAAAGKK
jgi:hypothetical protein